MKYIVLICFLFICPVFAQSQSFSSVLNGCGLEDVECVSLDDTLFVSFSNPTYRGNFRAPAVALKTIFSAFPDVKAVEMVVKENNIDKIAVHVYRDSVSCCVKADYKTSAISSHLKSRKTFPTGSFGRNSSYGKVNITFNPLVSLENNLLFKFYSYSIMLSPTIETSLWKGNHIVVQPIIPIMNNFEKDIKYDEEFQNKYFQLGAANVQQNFNFRDIGWAKLSIGAFRYNYYGICGNAGFHLTNRLDCGLYLSATKWYEFDYDIKRIHRDYNYGALMSLSYYEPHSSLEFKLTGGRFIYGDMGVRFDGVCHFGEYFIGAYAAYSGGEHNEGFWFGIPLAGKKQKRMGRVSLRLPESFDWEYSVVSIYGWNDKNCGKTVGIDAGNESAKHYWQAEYIRKYVQNILDGSVD